MTARLRRLLALFRRTRLDRELDAEIVAHLELAERDARARGLSVEEARREARQAFGGVDAVREAHRDARSTRALETLWRDVRYGLRGIRRTPLVCSIIVLVLGVAIGANTTMLSAVEAILVRPLGYGDADRLVIVMHDGRAPVSYANFDDWRREARSFQGMGAAEYWRVNIGLDEGAERVLGLRVTQDLLPLLDVAPALGRLPGADAFTGGDDKQVVISHGLWRRRFGGRASALGETLRLDGELYTVVAVMPPGFVFAPFWATESQLWAPLPHAGRPTSRTHNSLRVFARLNPGTSLAQAQADVTALTTRLESAFPHTNRNVRVVSLKERVVGETRMPLLVMLGGVGIVLIIACANVAHILLARAATRRREVAVRLALGATRTQIVRQFLVESLLLAGAAAIVGVALAIVGIDALVALAPPDLPRAADIRLDLPVLLGTVAMALTAGLGFGLAPALQAARPVPGEHLAAGRGASADRRQAATRELLMASEVALSLVLVAGAGLMVRSLASLQADDPAFDPGGVLSFSVSVLGSRQADADRRAPFYEALVEGLAALPGVTAVSAINHRPLDGDLWTRGMTIEGRTAPADGAVIGAIYRVSLPGYFTAMRIPIQRGRDFTWTDRTGTPGVAIISDDLARAHWPGEEAVGKRILFGQAASDPEPRWLTIVGVVADAAGRTWEDGRGSEVYLPFLQSAEYATSPTAPFSYLSFMVRTEPGREGALMPAVRRLVAGMDRDVAVSDVATMEEVVSRARARPRFQLTLLAVCAAVALLLAAAGIYGVVSYAVTRRTREIGLRMALGAQRGDVRTMVLRQSARHVGLGVGAGLIGAMLITRLMTGLLHGVTPGDPLTLGMSTLVLSAVALLASSVPAWRASRTAPVVALRDE